MADARKVNDGHSQLYVHTKQGVLTRRLMRSAVRIMLTWACGPACSEVLCLASSAAAGMNVRSLPPDTSSLPSWYPAGHFSGSNIQGLQEACGLLRTCMQVYVNGSCDAACSLCTVLILKPALAHRNPLEHEVLCASAFGEWQCRMTSHSAQGIDCIYPDGAMK